MSERVTEVSESIAIIGLAGRFPGAWDVEQLWANLRDGVDAISRPSDQELLDAGVTPEELADPAYVKAVPLVPGVDRFDAALFGFTPREAEVRDPQQRLFLEAAHAALESAGYDPTRVPGSCGVFAGAATNRYAEVHIRADERLAAQLGESAVNIGSSSDYVATTVSYRLGLRGPSLTLATACSSSLVAIHLACQSLRAGECDVALAGGVEVEIPYGHGYRWVSGGVRSADGRCRPFDAAANGTVFGNGAAVVVLKRLADALDDGDHIRAVIRGTAINNDGADKVSYSAPSVAGQVAVITEAMAVAEVAPEDISYVEAHGTATSLGDPIEVAALSKAWHALAGGDLPARSCLIGSVKSNLGHLGTAAGVAGLIKIVLALEHEQLPPTVHFTTPNPKLELDRTPFHVNDRLYPWPRVEGSRRVAALSSFGVGGTNAHAVIEEAPAAPPPPPDGSEPRLVVWSGRDQAAADAFRDRLARHFTDHGDGFADTVATLQVGRTPLPVRGAAVAVSAAGAAEALADPAGRHLLRRGRAGAARPVAFLFPGQGAQHRRMAAGLYGAEPAFTAAMDQCLALLRECGVELRDAWLEPDADASGDEAARLDATAVAQPLLFAVEYALARMWATWGVRPAAVLGHSIGELVAAVVAGVVGVEDGARLVAARGRAMQAMPPGGMLAVAASEEALGHLLGDEVALASVNGPEQAVLAGPLDTLAELERELRAGGTVCRRLRTSHAFHSPSMGPAVAEFERAFEGVVLRAPEVPLISAATGQPLGEDQARSPSFWASQLVEPVRFGAALDTLLAAGEHLLVEIGPGHTLSGLARRHPGVTSGRSAVVPTLPRGDADAGTDADRRAALAALGQVWVEGHNPDWTAVRQGRPFRRMLLPGYPYQRRRFWIDPPPRRGGTPATTTDGAATHQSSAPAPPTPAPAGAIDTPFTVPYWTEAPLEAPQVAAGAHLARGTALALLPDNRERSLPLVAALQQAGYAVVRVRPGAAAGRRDEEFQVRPGRSDDLGRVLDGLRERGVAPALLVHGWTIDPWEPASADNVDEQLDAAFYSLLALVQQGTRRPAGRPPAVLALTSRSVDVSGSEPLDPVKATLHGVIRTLAAEAPTLTWQLVDIGDGTSAADLASELLSGPRNEVVALRGSRRWAAAERPLRLPAAPVPPLRQGGTYLITGGLGGLGLTVARGLAQTGLQPNLVLLGRKGAPEGEERARLAAGGDEPAASVCRALNGLEQLGATVRTIACDVADRRQLRRALDVTTAHFGPVHGVVHAAGVAGGGLLQLRRREDAAAVLRPKVLGTLLLEELLAKRPPLDFFASFSSQAGRGGLIGGGDYAAANAFLDAHAATSRLARGQARSIAWPSWSTVGMAARSTIDLDRLSAGPAFGGNRHAARLAAPPEAPEAGAGEHRWEEVVSAETHWVLDEHRIGALPVLPGTGIIDLVLRAFKEAIGTGRGEAVRLHETVFTEPLAGPSARRVQVVFAPQGGKRGFRFRVRSHPVADVAAGWVEHATGTVLTTAGEPRRIDLAEIERRSRVVDRNEGDGPPARLFTLGPRWSCLEGVRTAGGELLVYLSLPAAFHGDLADHPLHPALLDVATAIARGRDDPPCLPFLYEELIAFDTLPERVLSHVRRRPSAQGTVVADVDLVTPDGTVVVAIRGFTMRPVADAALRDRLQAASSTPPPGDRDGETRGLDPDTGVKLFLELLAARTPHQVGVRPYVDGRPVPLAEPTGAAPAPAPAQTPAAPAPAPVATTPAAVPVAANEDGQGRDGETIRARLRGLWVEALGLDQIGDEDDFFDLGGNSLSAIQLVARVQEQLGVELSISELFERPTVRLLAEALAAREAAP